MVQRIGILGGSFDPVHYAHLLLAETSREQLELDAVWFVPAAAPPHKTDRQLAGDQHRVEMLALAISDHPQFAIERHELERGGVSYTVHTLEHFRQQHPQTDFFLIIGADALHDLPGWYQPQRICELAVLACAHRPGSPTPDFSQLTGLVDSDRLELFRRSTIIMPQMELSSTDLRQRVHAGRSIRFRTPRAVERYIATHRLYR